MEKFYNAARTAFNSLSPETKKNLGLIIAAGAAFKLAQRNPVVRIGVSLAGEVFTKAAGAVVQGLGSKAFIQQVRVVNWPPSLPGGGTAGGKDSSRKPSKKELLATLGLSAVTLASIQAIPPDWRWNDRSIAERAQRAMNWTMVASVIPMPAVVKAAIVPIVALVGFLKDEWQKQQGQMNAMHEQLRRNGGAGYPGSAGPIFGIPAYPAVPFSGLPPAGGVGRLVESPRMRDRNVEVNVWLDGKQIAARVQKPRQARAASPRLSLVGA
jgi:hypothetical protein